MYITPVIISQTQFINGKIGISKSLTLLFHLKIDIGPSWHNTLVFCWKINGGVLFKRLMETWDFDVICVGAGGAGVTAALSAAKAGARVAILSKEPIGYGDTRISKGVMAYAGLSQGDSPEEFYRDLLEGGEHLNDGELTKTISRETVLAVLTVEGFGHIFRRDEEGRISGKVLSPAGGHRFPRGLSSPSEGVSIGNALRAAITRAGIALFEETMTVKLYSEGGRIHGALALRLLSGDAVFFRAPSVVLATGGPAGSITLTPIACKAPQAMDLAWPTRQGLSL